MNPIAHPDGRPWGYWPREEGGWWVTDPAAHDVPIVGHVAPAPVGSGWQAQPWDRDAAYRSDRSPHEAARQLWDNHRPETPVDPTPVQPAAGPPIPDHLEVF